MADNTRLKKPTVTFFDLNPLGYGNYVRSKPVSDTYLLVLFNETSQVVKVAREPAKQGVSISLFRPGKNPFTEDTFPPNRSDHATAYIFGDRRDLTAGGTAETKVWMCGREIRNNDFTRAVFYGLSGAAQLIKSGKHDSAIAVVEPKPGELAVIKLIDGTKYGYEEVNFYNFEAAMRKLYDLGIRGEVIFEDGSPTRTIQELGMKKDPPWMTEDGLTLIGYGVIGFLLLAGLLGTYWSRIH